MSVKRTSLILLIPGMLWGLLSHAQTDGVIKALEIYNEGVAAYNRQDFKAAEDLFSQSLNIATDRDTYFSRGMARGKLVNQPGFCLDMAYAAAGGHQKAVQLFRRGCGSIDTAVVQFDDPACRRIVSREIRFHARDSAYTFLYRFSGQLLTAGYGELVKKNEAETDTAGPVSPAEFPGGEPELRKFIATRTKYPPESMSAGAGGKVFVAFDIFEDGTLQNITVIKGVAGHPEMGVEATRMVATMPPWKPAMKGKKRVKFRYELPVSFNVIR